MNDKPSAAARAGSAVGRVASSATRTTRAAIRSNPTVNRVYRTTVGVVGTTTVVLGVVLIPLPGPGSLIAIGGLALLGTEFEGAKKASGKANALAQKALASAKESRKRRVARRDDEHASDPCRADSGGGVAGSGSPVPDNAQ